MLLNRVLSACIAAVLMASPGAMAASVRDGQDVNQEAARKRQQTGRNLPVREIERRVVPQIKGARYLGFDFDPSTDIYTLKFLRNGSVIWVDVEGASGRILRRSGS